MSSSFVFLSRPCRKDAAKLDGSDPLLLNGYGSYEISNDPVSLPPLFLSKCLKLTPLRWIVLKVFYNLKAREYTAPAILIHQEGTENEKKAATGHTCVNGKVPNW